ncbi:methyltransferase domain-containing protein [Falsihalocynthiibacter sp. BN13B15]|uniref:methyltransferase domain-containing protein n=1 Tax=Falsihalocynthiibacter sp. BN13B15 TaxID=3240871 RepID=UPI00350EB11E
MIDEHWGYVSDTARTALLERAISKTVRCSDHVLDLGCGVGILGTLCLQAGAAGVTAIESTSVADVAREVFERAGQGEKCNVLQGNANQLKLDRAVDLIVCDHVGYFGLDYGILALLHDARTRFLKKEGRIMPMGVDLFLAPVGSEGCAKAAFGWSAQDIPPEFHWITEHSINHKHAVNLEAKNILGTPFLADSVDFRTETRSFFSWKTELTITRAGEMHGLAGWFDCTLCEGVKMTNSPLNPERINRSQAFFPLSKPLHVAKNDVLQVTFVLRPDEDLFSWSVEHAPSGWKCRQSTWEGLALNAHDMRNAKPDHIPNLTATAKARAIVLGYCDGQKTVSEIEKAVLKDHPNLFPTSGAISQFVASCLGGSTE